MNRKIVFAGGTDWSVEFLNTLIKEGFNIIGILAPPDSKRERDPAPSGAGRGHKLSVHLLKAEVSKLNIPVFQPEKLSDSRFLRDFKKIKPDAVVVVAYGKLFPREILAVPPQGFINFHPSLLPRLRGPSPIMSAILEGHKETGVSIMKLGEGMDDGPLLDQESVKIDPRETTETLTRKLVDLGKEKLPNILKLYLAETRYGGFLQQDDAQATYCKMIKKEDGKINWHKETAEQIDRKIRALNPQFKTFAFLANNKRVNILESAGTQRAVFLPGECKLVNNNLAIGTKKATLLVSKLQVEGKKPISAKDFIAGYRDSRFL